MDDRDISEGWKTVIEGEKSKLIPKFLVFTTFKDEGAALRRSFLREAYMKIHRCEKEGGTVFLETCDMCGDAGCIQEIVGNFILELRRKKQTER